MNQQDWEKIRNNSVLAEAFERYAEGVATGDKAISQKAADHVATFIVEREAAARSEAIEEMWCLYHMEPKDVFAGEREKHRKEIEATRAQTIAEIQTIIHAYHSRWGVSPEQARAQMKEDLLSALSRLAPEPKEPGETKA